MQNPSGKIQCANIADPIELYICRDYFAVKRSETVGEVLVRLRNAQIGDRILYFYVIEQDGTLSGVVPTRRLIVSESGTLIEKIMVEGVVSISKNAALLDACQGFLMHRFLALPVVDEKGRMVGILDISQFSDEMLDIAERRSYDDLFQLVGVHLTHTFKATPMSSFRDRFPWLLVNILGGLICAWTAAKSEVFLNHFIVIAMFIPVVLALAESISIQSVTLTIQKLHSGNPDWNFFRKTVGAEAAAAFLIGLAAGAIVGLISTVWKGEPNVGLALGSSIALSMFTVSILGAIFPILLKSLRLNPQVAAGPVVLATADVFTLILYLRLSENIFKHFA
ncbi:MAG: magnesium transporter [Calditrichaeota bacterium]|nr:magnesium transporter [Calditrichota bacterium]